MPEPTAPAAPTPPPAAPNQAPDAPKPTVARPDFLPEEYWDAEAGAPKLEQLARDRTEIGQRFAKGREAYAEELRTELEAERLKERPATPAEYALAPPKALPDDLVLLAEPPGADFQPEPGKRYFVMQPDHPLLGWWRETAHAKGLNQEEFAAGIAQFAAAQGWREPTKEERLGQQKAFYASLGEKGVERVEMLWGKLKSTLGDKAAALDAVVSTKEQVEALEELVARAGGAGFTAAGGTVPGQVTRAELEKLMQDPRYYRDHDAAIVKQVEAGFAALYPGRRPG